MNAIQTTPNITPLEARPTGIEGLFIITLRQIEDARGVIRELFRESALREVGLKGFGTWRQINTTETKQGVIRGLHGEEMWKLISVVEGTAFGAYVDVRPESLTRGKVVTVKLTKGVQVLVPQGVCNGFQSTSEGISQYTYCFDAEWTLGMKGYSVTPLDPTLGIAWPIPVSAEDEALISRKDAEAPTLKEALAFSMLDTSE